MKPSKGGETPPPNVVTVTERMPSAAPESIEMRIATNDALLLSTLAVTPDPLNVTADAPVRTEPVK